MVGRLPAGAETMRHLCFLAFLALWILYCAPTVLAGKAPDGVILMSMPVAYVTLYGVPGKGKGRDDDDKG